MLIMCISTQLPGWLAQQLLGCSFACALYCADSLVPAADLLAAVCLLAAAAAPQELLVPVPTQLFQGSLLLGSVTRLALGPEALARPDVMISPLVIAGG